jgi:hypothetical protein
MVEENKSLVEKELDDDLQDNSSSKVESRILKEIGNNKLAWTKFIDYLYIFSIFITLLILGFAVFSVAVDLTYVFVLILFGFIPALITYMIDMQKGKFLAKSVTAMNLAGVFPLVILIIKSDSPYEASQNIVYSMRTWIITYSYAILGWWISAFFPSIIKIIIELNNAKSIYNIKRKQEIIIEEWGMDVKVGTFDPEIYKISRIKNLKSQLKSQ